jgi:RNA polymerase sigma-32 factor
MSQELIRKDFMRADVALPMGSIETYVNRVMNVPMLTQEQEYQLAERWHLHQDVEAARILVLSHLRFVVKIARGFMGYGLQLSDLIQEGNIGLMKAVKRFNPEVGVRLVSFAVHWIKAEIHEFIIRNWRIVRVATTKAQRKLFFNLRRSKQRLGWMTREEVEGVATDLGVSAREVLEMESRLNAHDAAFDAPNTEEEDHSGHQYPVEYLAGGENPAVLHEESHSAEHQEGQLHQAMNQLDARSQDIVQRRWLNDQKATLQELAAEYNVSAERIRQLENAAMKKIREQMEEL